MTKIKKPVVIGVPKTTEEQKGVYSWQLALQVEKCMCDHCKEIWKRAEHSDHREALKEWSNS